jgi:flagellar motility protein MotE (MotC chaperone)
MTRILRDVRLIPIVLLATASLFVLKVSGLVLDGGYTLADRLQGRDKNDLKVTTRGSVPDYPKIVVASSGTNAAKKSWAQQMFSYGGPDGADITGSVGASENKPADPPLKVSDKAPDQPKLEVGDSSVLIEPGRIASPGERAVLERLQERRRELDSRSHELDMRENLIKAAEKRLEAKVTELKDVEARITTADASREKAQLQRYQSIVVMYENMKPKDAARIFDRLDLKILVDVSTQMKPAKMADILAQMTPESAERLTVELANRASARPTVQSVDQLPKIEGKASGS